MLLDSCRQKMTKPSRAYKNILFFIGHQVFTRAGYKLSSYTISWLTPRLAMKADGANVSCSLENLIKAKEIYE